MNVLAVGAHPADVFDLAGGTLANFASDGHGVYVACLSHGALSHSQAVTGKDQRQAVDEVREMKRRECENAAAAVGVAEVRYFPCDDEPYLPTRDSILALGEFIREVAPEILITHHPKEYGHPDHPVAGEAVLRSVKAAERWIEGSLRPPHKVRRVYFFGTQFRGICARLGSVVAPADFIVDITRSVEKKTRAVASFQSQSFMGEKYEDAWARERIQRIEGHWGFMSGVRYAEEFISLAPQIVPLLP